MTQLPSLQLEGFAGYPYPYQPAFLFLIYCLHKTDASSGQIKQTL
jgi:hypothetical protein